jgi:hypothetical protein
MKLGQVGELSRLSPEYFLSLFEMLPKHLSRSGTESEFRRKHGNSSFPYLVGRNAHLLNWTTTVLASALADRVSSQFVARSNAKSPRPEAKEACSVARRPLTGLIEPG